MKLVIVESPTKAKTLAKFLGKDYRIEASMGHVRDLPKSTLGVDVEHKFKPEYVEVADREQTIKELKKAAKTAKKVILATDPDREGEAIAYHVSYLLRNGKKDGLKTKISRIVFHEITKGAVERALEKPGKINMALVHAQQGRRVLDRLVGYKLSPILWRKVRRGLSAGRVQSVAVKMMVEREREIEAFKPEEYWYIDVEVQRAGQKGQKGEVDAFVVRLAKIGEKRTEVGSKSQANSIVADLEKAKYAVAQVNKKEVKRSPPPPFMTSTLQRMASNRMGWSGRKTMRAAQRLYEAGLITYHRTDSLNVANQALKQVSKYILETYGEQYGLEEPRRFRSKSKSAQEAHEAIRPTKAARVSAQGKKRLAGDSTRLYSLIWRRFVASQMKEARYDRTTVEVKAQNPQNKKAYLLRVTGRVMKFDGWMKLYEVSEKKSVRQAQDKKAESGKPQLKEDDEQRLPEVDEGELLLKKKVMAEQKFTEPPARYNEASLIKALEERGIGRPSTYAPTISTIQARQYVEKKDQRFYPTSVGITVTDFLAKYFTTVMDYDFTAEMENDLDTIAHGKKKWVEVVKAFYGPFAKKVKKVGDEAKRVKVPVEKTGKKCPECLSTSSRSKKPGEVVIRIGRFGKFLSCSRFPDCKYTSNYVEKVEGVKCPDDGGNIVIRKTRKGKRFYGCSNYPKCKWASWRKPGQAESKKKGKK